MRTLAIAFAAVFLITMSSAPTLGAGWFWDTGNAFGFVAFVGLIYLSFASARTLHVSAHRFLGYAVLLIAAAHVFWLLLGDAVVVEYIRPGAPHYMWAGVAAFTLLNLMTVLGLPNYRRRIHRDYDSFRMWHRWMAIGVIGGSAWHIVGAGHYLRSAYQWLLLLLITLVASFAYRVGLHSNDLDRVSSRVFLIMAAMTTFLFVLIRNLPA